MKRLTVVTPKPHKVVVPKLEPKGTAKQATSGDVTKTGAVRSTEGPRP